MKLVTIVAEAVLRERLVELVDASGATGYTITGATGRGSRGLRSTTVLDSENMRLETLVSENIASRIIDTLAGDYFPHYAVVVWVADVEVVRGGKFGPK